MKYVCTVFVYVYTLNFFTIKISAFVLAFVYYETIFSCLLSLVSECSTKKSGAYY